MASKRLLIASWVMLVIVTGASGEAAHEGALTLRSSLPPWI